MIPSEEGSSINYYNMARKFDYDKNLEHLVSPSYEKTQIQYTFHSPNSRTILMKSTNVRSNELLIAVKSLEISQIKLILQLKQTITYEWPMSFFRRASK